MGLVFSGVLTVMVGNAAGGVANTDRALTNFSSPMPMLSSAQTIVSDPFASMLAPPAPAMFRAGLKSSHPEQDAVAAPEPTSLSLLAVGLGMIAVARRKRRWFR
ncbi:MAG TPA: PEP-CTERM sorting domain-containing protein [Tepidisphaeraceae bacterium]|nr:PEP-CTERM sorting domain-containing protein [Tepidisphaeraceae bacterium]